MAPQIDLGSEAVIRARIAAVETIDDWQDPRLDDYRNLTDRQLDQTSGKFIAESERVVRKLLASSLPIQSVLLTPPRLATLAPYLDDRCPVYLASQTVMDRVAGFHVHRGCLAVGSRPSAPALPERARLLVAAENLVDVDNVGALVRNATAFGAEGLLLSPGCADPFYRKAIRVAAGNTFALPMVRLERWPEDLRTVADRFAMKVYGTVIDDSAQPLAHVQDRTRAIVLFGSEGPGLSEAARRCCDGLITIPMHGGADSLNVATAAAVVLYHLSTVLLDGASADARPSSL